MQMVHSLALPSCVFRLAILRSIDAAPQVAEPAKEDTPTQIESPVLAQDTPDLAMESLDWRTASPGVYEDAYIQPSASLGATEAPLGLVENGRAYLGVSVLDSLMDIQHDSILLHSELEAESSCGVDTTPCTVTGSIPELLYVIAFSHLSRPRYASPTIAPNSADSQVHHTPPPDSADFPPPCIIDSPNVSFIEPLSTAFVRPASPLPPSSPSFINYYPGSDDVTIPLFPLPSSPVPSSSPPNFFTSSPGYHALYKSLPTSPAPEKHMPDPSRVGPNPLKRSHCQDTMETPAGDQGGVLGEGTPKKRVRYIRYIATLVALTLPLEVEHA